MSPDTLAAEVALAASYARISDNDGAGAGVGVGDQHRRNGKRAVSDGITIAYELTDDDRSAYKEDVIRDDYQRLLDLIRADKVRYVLVKHADRLHRQPEEAEAFLKLARAKSVVVITATGMRYLFDTADGRRAFRDAANAAAYESDHRGERVEESHERRAAEGEYRGGPHRPFGWGVPTGVVRRVRDKRTGKPRDVEILEMSQHNEAEAEQIRRWADDVLADVELNQITRSTTTPTITGVPWHPNVVRNILLSPRVAGHSVYKGQIAKSNAWDAILEEDTWQAVRMKLTDPARRTSPGSVPKWLGSRIYLCGICDADPSLTQPREYEMKVGGGRRQNHPAYRCQLRSHCKRRTGEVDAYVEDVVFARLACEDLSDLLPGRSDIDAPALREQVGVLEQRKLDAALAFAGDGDLEVLATVKAAVDNQIRRIRAELAAAAARSPVAEFEGVDTVEEAREVWNSLTLGRQRQIIRSLMTVVLMPPPMGRRGKGWAFDKSSVVIRWESSPSHRG